MGERFGRWIGALWVSLCFVASTSVEAFDLYFVRHAQTMANVTREYTPENQRIFSPLGQVQVGEVTAKLAGFDFDVILVSPAYRTMHTILPHLEATGKQAEIWPELYECCWDRESVDGDPVLAAREPIEIDEDLQPHFRFRDEAAVHWLDVDTPDRGELSVAQAVELLRARFGGTDLKILVVSHYHTGSRFLRALLGDRAPRRIQPANARLTHLRQEADGGFELLMMNDVPVEE